MPPGAVRIVFTLVIFRLLTFTPQLSEFTACHTVVDDMTHICKLSYNLALLYHASFTEEHCEFHSVTAIKSHLVECK
jgi:hypothetical protein